MVMQDRTWHKLCFRCSVCKGTRAGGLCNAMRCAADICTSSGTLTLKNFKLQDVSQFVCLSVPLSRGRIAHDTVR